MDVDLERIGGALGRFFAPQRIDQALTWDDLVRPQDEQREKGPLLRPAKRERGAVVVVDLDGSKDPEVRLLPLALSRA